MTSRHQLTGTSEVTNGKKSLLTCGEIECVPLSGMVIQERLSEEPNNKNEDSTVHIEEWTNDDDSCSSTGSQNDGGQSEKGLDIVAANDCCAGSFGNIVVKNSSEVQFGNNTYYQGPVVIKQFVYKSDQNGQQSIENGTKDNLAFLPEPDCVIEPTVSDCVKSDKNIDKNADNNSNFISDNIPLSRGTQWLHYVHRNRVFLLSCLAVCIIALIICVSVIIGEKQQYTTYSDHHGSRINKGDTDEQDKNTPIDPPIDPDVNLTVSGKLRIIARQEWLAQPPTQPASPLNHPVPYVIILHTATENCSDQATCTFHVRYIQTFHIESKGWWDIAYNFLVGGDGCAYEGRGWAGEGANAYGYNSKSIGISFIGTFNNILPPERQIRAAKQLIELGVKKGYIAADYKLLAHRQLSGTLSPGEALYENMKTWPHWSKTP